MHDAAGGGHLGRGGLPDGESAAASCKQGTARARDNFDDTGHAAADEGTGLERVEVAGTTVVVSRRDLIEQDFDECLDPCFFEEDYTVAASTGFHVWEGCWILVDELRATTPHADGRPPLAERLRGKRVVELGAGTGLGGLCAGAVGAHVLLTDVPSVVWGMLEGNIQRNRRGAITYTDVGSSSSSGGGGGGGGGGAGDVKDEGAAGGTTPAALGDGGHSDANGGGSASGSDDAAAMSCASPPSAPWPRSVPVGRGTAAAVALDWTLPVAPTGEIDPTDTDVIVAAECVWLAELVPPFVATVTALLRGPRKPWCLLCFRDRSGEASETFVAMSAVVDAFRAASCEVTRVSEHDVARERDKGKTADSSRKVVMYEVRLAGGAVKG